VLPFDDRLEVSRALGLEERDTQGEHPARKDSDT
jgi:hypothetical protein